MSNTDILLWAIPTRVPTQYTRRWSAWKTANKSITQLVAVLSNEKSLYFYNWRRKCFINFTLNTFYLRLYGVGNEVKDHLAGEESRCCHNMRYSFRSAARVLLYARSHRQDSTAHTTTFVNPVVEQWLER